MAAGHGPESEAERCWGGPRSEPSWAARSDPTTVRCMQGMLSGGLLTAAFAAVAGLALVVLVRLLWISRPGGKARTDD